MIVHNAICGKTTKMIELVRLDDVIETVRGFVKYIEELPRAGDELISAVQKCLLNWRGV